MFLLADCFVVERFRVYHAITQIYWWWMQRSHRHVMRNINEQMQWQNGSTHDTWKIYTSIFNRTNETHLNGLHTFTNCKAWHTVSYVWSIVNMEMWRRIDTSTIKSIESEVKMFEIKMHPTFDALLENGEKVRRHAGNFHSITISAPAVYIVRSVLHYIFVLFCFCTNESNTKVKYLRKTYFIGK